MNIQWALTNFSTIRGIFLSVILAFFSLISHSQEEEFRFQLLVDNASVASPIGLELKKISASKIDYKEPLVIFEEVDGKSIEIPLQLDQKSGKLWFIGSPGYPSGSLVTYCIKNGVPSQKKSTSLKEKIENGNLQLWNGERPLISYRYEITYPPNGIDPLFKKSGYIHPILTPKGDTLTRIQPPDHYHHFGLWGPWTHTQIDGDRVDFWNLGEGMGTVLFKDFKDRDSGNVLASFTAVQEHIDLKTKRNPQVALNENLEVRLWNLNRPDRYMFDYSSEFLTPLEKGILFEAYRYGGGIGLRFTERWKADNCSVLTSDDKDRTNADGSNARWCIISGESSDGMGTNGILFMSHPENRAHPEPMRIWPKDANGGRGDMFFEFCPIRHKEWQIKPKTSYELKYRMVVFDGKLTAEEAESYWQSFAKQPEIKI